MHEMRKSIHHELLSSEGMRRIHAAVKRKYKFVFHNARQQDMQCVARDGLLLQVNDSATDAGMECVKHFRGVLNPGIVCFSPGPSDIHFSDGDKREVLALCTSDLPMEVGVDWSFGGYWSYVENQRKLNPDQSLEDVFLNAFDYFKSLVVYEPIPTHALRIQKDPLSSDPSNWPSLSTLGGWWP